jgi:uncharacterized protein
MEKFTIEETQEKQPASLESSNESLRQAPLESVSLLPAPLHERLARLLQQNRFAIAAELVLVVTLVTAFPQLTFTNIFSVFLIFSALLWLRGVNWRAVGLASPPRNWRRIVCYALLLVLASVVFQWLVLGPISTSIIHQRADVHIFMPIQGTPLALLSSVINAWTTSAFGEEMIFRGYLLKRITDLFSGSRLGIVIAVICQALLFGLWHGYQGLPGVINASIFGLLAGFVSVRMRGNLWVGILAHGLSDTLAYLLIFVR